MGESKANVSVIMRTKNSDWVVRETLQGLFFQDFQDFELLVVDSGSTDRTLEIVRQYPARIIEIEPAAYFPGAVLNMAIEHVTGELIVFLNSDSVPQHPEALRNLIKSFDDPSVKAAFARQIPRPEAHGWVQRDYALSFPERGPAPDWITLSLPMAALRRSCWDEHHFYTAAWASEDTEWGLWARSMGYTIQYVPEAVVMHSHNYTLRQLYGRRYVEGEADAFIYGNRETHGKALMRWFKAIVNDTVWSAKSLDFRELVTVPGRRFVYAWAYLRGHKWGEDRRARHDDDPSKGQLVVLSRYD